MRCLRKLLNVPRSVENSTTTATVLHSGNNQTTTQDLPTLIDGEHSSNTDHLTWHTMFQRLDLVVFVFMSVIVVTATPIFFAFLSLGSNE